LQFYLQKQAKKDRRLDQQVDLIMPGFKQMLDPMVELLDGVLANIS